MKKIIIRLIIIIVPVLFSLCTSDNTIIMKWKTFDFLNIPGETRYMGFASAISNYDLKQGLIVNYKKFILIGSNDPQAMDYEPYPGSDAVVFTTQDGGETFQKTVIGKGVCDRVFYADNAYYITVATGEKGWSSYLVKADIAFTKFEVIGTYNDVVIDDVHFYNQQIAVAGFFSYYDRNTMYKFTEDGGKTWNKFLHHFKDNYRVIRVVSDTEVDALCKNQIIRLNFKTGEEKTLYSQIFPSEYKLQDYVFISALDSRLYVYLKQDKKPNEKSIKFLDNNEIIELPKGVTAITVYGDYLHTMEQDGPWYKYIYSTNRGKTWHTEKMRDFFVTPNPIAYFGKGMVVAIIADFKRKYGEKREAYLAIRQAND